METPEETPDTNVADGIKEIQEILTKRGLEMRIQTMIVKKETT